GRGGGDRALGRCARRAGHAGTHRVIVSGTARMGAAYGRHLRRSGGREPASAGSTATRFRHTARLMKVLVVGAGGVGAAFAAIAQRRRSFERVVLADVATERVRSVVARLGEPGRFAAERVDASNASDVVALIRRVAPDAVLNACDPRLNGPIFSAALEARVTYIDMAMTLSRPHPQPPYELPWPMLGDRPPSRHDASQPA